MPDNGVDQRAGSVSGRPGRAFGTSPVGPHGPLTTTAAHGATGSQGPIRPSRR